MIELVHHSAVEKWNNIIESYKMHDIYFRCEYAVSFMKNEGGIPYLLNYEGNKGRFCYPIIEKDIADSFELFGDMPRGLYFDWNTPYGYGGPLSDERYLDLTEQEDFKKELFALAKSRNVVSQFVRFHPLLQNHTICSNVIETVYVKDTVFINLETEDDLMKQMDSKNRNLIRKAQKNNVVIRHDKGQFVDEFIRIYETTMDRDGAREFYYFPKSYYEYVCQHMTDQTEFFYALKDEKIIAASVFFYSGSTMHYHLSGNYVDYRTYAPTNLILYEAANWGRSIGLKSLHLGGGLGAEDSLFHFKKQFNRNGRIGFYMGRNIFNYEKYQELLTKRKELDAAFDMNNTYYIQYRQPKG